jgi:hypothetical protein
MTTYFIMTPEMITLFSYAVVAAMAIGFIPWLKVSDIVRLAVVLPMLNWLANS